MTPRSSLAHQPRRTPPEKQLAVHGYGVHQLLLRRKVLAAQGRDGPLRAVLPDTPLRGVGPGAGAAGRGLGALQQQERGHMENLSGYLLLLYGHQYLVRSN